MTTRLTLRLCALALPLLALAACDSVPDLRPVPPPRTPGSTVSAAPTTPGSAAAAAAAEARTGVIEGALPQSAAAQQAGAAPAAGGRLGTTIASLGDATEGGMWIKTPLVSAPGKGRIVDRATGRSVNVDLLPLAGPASGGSQVSLPALTRLGADLTDLPELDVYRS